MRGRNARSSSVRDFDLCGGWIGSRRCYQRDINLTLTGDGEAQLLRGTVVTADLFPLLGVSPVLGRPFLTEEDQAGGGSGGRPALLSWEVWQEQFGGASSIVGRAVEFNNSRFTVVGVMPAGFSFPIQAQPTQVWITTALDNERPEGPGAIMVARGYRGWRAIGRLKAGVTTEQAQSELDIIAANSHALQSEIAAHTSDHEDTDARGLHSGQQRDRLGGQRQENPGQVPRSGPQVLTRTRLASPARGASARSA